MFDITTAEVQAVSRFVSTVAAIKYHRTKKATFLREVPELSEAATWLLTFRGNGISSKDWLANPCNKLFQARE